MPTLREALGAAIANTANDVDDTEVTDTEDPADVAETAPNDADPVDAAAETEPEPEELVAGEDEQPAGDRDEQGRFKPKGAKQASGQPAAAKPGAVDPALGKAKGDAAAAATAGAGPLKAPSSWKPAAREAFAKAPREVQEEAVRIDKEVRQVMQQSAGARQFVESFGKMVAPYESLIRADQRGRPYDPITAAASLFQTAAVLRTGTPQQKIDLVAEIITSYGLSSKEALVALDKVLTKRLGGESAPDEPGAAGAGKGAPSEFRDPRLDKYLQDQEQEQQQRQRELLEQGAADVASFSEKAEFFNDVRKDMFNLMAAATQAGEMMSLQEAYDTALALPKHKSIQGILKQRADAEEVKRKTAALRKTRAASSSIRPNPTGGAAPATDNPTLRDTIAENWDAANSRQ